MSVITFSEVPETSSFLRCFGAQVQPDIFSVWEKKNIHGSVMNNKLYQFY